MFNIGGNDMNQLEMFIWDFHLNQHFTEIWKSVISIGMSDGGHTIKSLDVV